MLRDIRYTVAMDDKGNFVGTLSMQNNGSPLNFTDSEARELFQVLRKAPFSKTGKKRGRPATKEKHTA